MNKAKPVYREDLSVKSQLYYPEIRKFVLYSKTCMLCA